MITVLIMLSLGIIASYYYIKNINYYIENINLQKENLELSKPYIIKTDLLVRSKVQNVNFPLYVRNPSRNEYTLELSKSICDFETNLVHRYIPEKNETMSNISVTSNLGNEVIINPSLSPTMISLTPNTTIQLQCSGFSIDQTINKVHSFMNVCIKLTTFKDLICEKIPIQIVPPRIITINGTVS